MPIQELKYCTISRYSGHLHRTVGMSRPGSASAADLTRGFQYVEEAGEAPGRRLFVAEAVRL